MLKIGITGNIGSGKSTVCRIFQVLGVPVYDADTRAKALMQTHEPLKQQIKAALGEESYTPEGVLDRAYIAQLVFKNPEKLQQLNALVHPAVAADTVQWFAEQQGAPYALKEAALLYEVKAHLSLDKVIVVSAPQALRLARTLRRDNVTKEQFFERENKQLPQAWKEAQADFIIYNDEQRLLIPQIMKIHQSLLVSSQP